MHIRSICNLEIPKPLFTCYGEMYNIISNLQTIKEIIKKLNNSNKNIENVIIKDYNKEPIGIRKIGHINIKY